MVRAHPRPGRDIGEIARVAVSVRLATGSLTEADRLCGGAEEDSEGGGGGEGGGGTGGVVGGEGDAVLGVGADYGDRKSTRLNSSHSGESRMPSSA